MSSHICQVLLSWCLSFSSFPSTCSWPLNKLDLNCRGLPILRVLQLTCAVQTRTVQGLTPWLGIWVFGGSAVLTGGFSIGEGVPLIPALFRVNIITINQLCHPTSHPQPYIVGSLLHEIKISHFVYTDPRIYSTLVLPTSKSYSSLVFFPIPGTCTWHNHPCFLNISLF